MTRPTEAQKKVLANLLAKREPFSHLSAGSLGAKRTSLAMKKAGLVLVDRGGMKLTEEGKKVARTFCTKGKATSEEEE